MRGGTQFADMLDEKIGGAPIEPPRAAGRATPRYAPDPILLFFDTRFRLAQPTTPFAPPLPPTPAVAQPRPRRSLTTREQDALRAFWGLGARIGVDFTEPELRSAYRSLARRYHPDTHPHSSRTETARLARIFANLTDCYRLLLDAAA